MTNVKCKMTNEKMTLTIPDPSLILLIGPSGAGKSTFARRFFQPTEIVSSDSCRALICDDEGDQSINSETFGLLHHITRLRLSVRRLTVIDATNLQYRARRPLLRIARIHRMPAVAIVFNTSLETCLSNNLTRPHRFVAEDAIKHHALELSIAMTRLSREGYERIFVLDESQIRSAMVERKAVSSRQ
jgi:protein phosphatase